MWVTIGKRFEYEEHLGNTYEHEVLFLRKIVNSLDDVKSGEIFFKCNIKK